MLRRLPLQLCSRTPRLLPAARSCKRMDNLSASHSTMEHQSQLTSVARDLRKLQLFPRTSTKLERTFMPACWRSLLSHTTPMLSEADSPSLLLWCHIRTPPKSSLEIEALTTRDSSFPPTRTPLSSQSSLRQLTQELFPRRPSEESICKSCEGPSLINNNWQLN